MLLTVTFFVSQIMLSVVCSLCDLVYSAGCDLTIAKDKGVSRIHAEILVDAMIPLNSHNSHLSNICSKVRISDCSKYGTFVRRNSGLKEKLHELSKKEASLCDGDVVSFGSGNATYR